MSDPQMASLIVASPFLLLSTIWAVSDAVRITKAERRVASKKEHRK